LQEYLAVCESVLAARNDPGIFSEADLTAIAALIAILIGLTVLADIGRELPGDEGNVTKTTIIRMLPGFMCG